MHPTHRIARGVLLKASLRHDIRQEVTPASQALASDLRRKRTGGSHMLGAETSLQQSLVELLCLGSAFTSHRAMKAVPLLTKTSQAACFPARFCSLMKLVYVQSCLSSMQESRG